MAETDTVRPAHEEVAQLETEIEALAERIENGRKLARLAQAAVAAGIAALVLFALGILRGSPAVLVFGIAAILGGFTLMGSNRTTLAQLQARMDALQARRAATISGLQLRIVS